MGRRTSILLAAALAVTALAILVLHVPSAIPERMLAGSMQEEAATIFVSVASYRDDDCSGTLRDMYAKAKNPARVFAGVCQQNKPGEEAEECVDPALPWRQNVRVVTMPHTDAKGPTYARYQCARLYAGETFFCQIDSHTKFVQDWDEVAIQDLRRCPAAKPVLSYYPHDSKTNPADVATVPVLCKSKFDGDNVITFEAVTMPAATGTPKPIPFAAGGFFFGPGSIPREVPFDPSLDHLFNGEEIAFSARLWTSGYDIFAPMRNVVLHYYTRKDKPKYWEDIANYRDVQKASQQRVIRLLGLDGKPPLTGYTWGMGTERTLEAYLAFAGIDPASKTTTSAQKFCRA